MIDRKALVGKHQIILNRIEPSSPLSVGNGDFAFTADVTGLQSLYREYGPHFPLCTMGSFGWHTEPAEGKREGYTLSDLWMQQFQVDGRQYRYPSAEYEGNREVYRWLRENPHKFSLYRLAAEYRGREIAPEDLSGICQKLDLYDGRLESRYRLGGADCLAETACSGEEGAVGVRFCSAGLADGSIRLVLSFPYASPEISGADWTRPQRHESRLTEIREGLYLIERRMDGCCYQVAAAVKGGALARRGRHEFEITGTGPALELVVCAEPWVEWGRERSVERVFASARAMWNGFWERTGIIDFGGTRDERAVELERREILSLYLLRLQCCGALPPAETGLSCNSWYGKFHLEMHFWHCAYLPLYHNGGLLRKSLGWYREHLDAARKNAEGNSYRGARWPKMVGYDGQDSPSPIGPFLIWQQPHILSLLELLYRSEGDGGLLEEYWDVVRETADFMADFVRLDPVTGRYDLDAPLIPAQENYHPLTVKNPAFELEYWKAGLEIAAAWARRLGKDGWERWMETAGNLAELPVGGGLYLAHERAEDTFSRHAKDHPSMLMALGLLGGGRVDRKRMEATLERVRKDWDFETAWGWDFGVMAMTAARLGKRELAVELLLMDTPKNRYRENGHNSQGTRGDLPLYLPGNGSLLLALAVMTAGYEGCEEAMPGIPEGWKVQAEGIDPLIF